MLNSTKGHDGSEYDILNDKKPHRPERGKIYKHFLVPSCMYIQTVELYTQNCTSRNQRFAKYQTQRSFLAKWKMLAKDLI